MNGRMTAVVVVTTAALVGGGIAYASIPGSDGVIKACYLKSGGSLRVIDSERSCAKSETTLTWNQSGVPGHDGADGQDGADGVSGYEVVTRDVTFPPDVLSVFASATVGCPDGKRVLGGGAIPLDDEDGSEITTTAVEFSFSLPTAEGTGWRVGYSADTSFVSGIRLYATCASAS